LFRMYGVLAQRWRRKDIAVRFFSGMVDDIVTLYIMKKGLETLKWQTFLAKNRLQFMRDFVYKHAPCM
jgi:hypothetical protein